MMGPPGVGGAFAAEAELHVGYGTSAPVPAHANGILTFQPGESVAVRVARRARVMLTGPAGSIVSEMVLDPAETPVVLHTFSIRDEPKEHRLWVDGELQPLRLLMERRFVNGNVNIRFAFVNATLRAQVINTPTELTFFLGTGPRNYLLPESAITPDFLVALGIAPEGAFEAEVRLQYRKPLAFVVQATSPLADARPGMIVELPAIVAQGIVRREVASAPDGSVRIIDTPLALPAVHVLGAGGVMPLRYGSALLSVRPVGESGSSVSVEHMVPVIPTELEAGWALGEEQQFALSQLPQLTTLRLVSVIDNGQRARIALGQLPIPVGTVQVVDVAHGRPLPNYELLIDAPAAVRVDDATIVLFYDLLPGVSRYSLIPIAPVYRANYTLRVNGFPVQAEPGNLTSSALGSQTLAVRLVDLRVQVANPGAGMPPQLILENAFGRYTLATWRADLSLPPGNYTVRVLEGARQAQIELDLREDASVVVALPPAPLPVLEMLQVAAMLEVALLTGVLVLRRKEGHQSG
jgi:hypothetical protein